MTAYQRMQHQLVSTKKENGCLLVAKIVQQGSGIYDQETYNVSVFIK
jgi:hypothetical protein